MYPRILVLCTLSTLTIACGAAPLKDTVRYARLSVNTTMVATQAADEANGKFFEDTSDTVSKAAYDQWVLPVAESMGLENEENVCSDKDLAITDEAKAELKTACDKGYAQYCLDIKPVYKDHCLRTCVIGTTKDGLREGEQVVDDLEHIQKQYSADSTFKQLKEEHKLTWTDYLGEFKTWFKSAVKHLAHFVQLLHDTDKVDIPPALETITDIAGSFVELEGVDVSEPPVCACTDYPPDSGCEEAVKMLDGE